MRSVVDIQVSLEKWELDNNPGEIIVVVVVVVVIRVPFLPYIYSVIRIYGRWVTQTSVHKEEFAL